MPNVDVPVDAKLEQAAALLEERFDPRAIVLFGSRAQGRQRADSDYDLAMLVGRPVPAVFAVATARSDLEDLLGGAAIERCLARIRVVTGGNPERVDDAGAIKSFVTL